jgi:ParB family transcriptional regulator, chromosome partitioning protein
MNDKRKPLGRGLDSLLPASRATAPRPATAHGAAAGTVPAIAASAPHGEVIQEISVNEIERNPYQTRNHMDDTSLAELAASIVATGVLQPVVLRYIGEGKKYQLIAGERRWLASQAVGKTTVPAIVRQVSNAQAMEMTIIENLQRADLNAIEQARAFERLSREFGLTQEQVANRTGKDRASVSNFLRLLKLPLEIQTLIEQDKLSMGHAKALLMLESPDTMTTIAARVADQGMSVRGTEELVHSFLEPREKPTRKPRPEREVDPNVREAERELERALGCKVRIQDRSGRGSIQIDYASLEDFDRVLDALGVNR